MIVPAPFVAVEEKCLKISAHFTVLGFLTSSLLHIHTSASSHSTPTEKKVVKLIFGGAKKEARVTMSEFGAGERSVQPQPPSVPPLHAPGRWVAAEVIILHCLTPPAPEGRAAAASLA